LIRDSSLSARKRLAAAQQTAQGAVVGGGE